jgi:putative phosphoribosyl transferase
MAMPHAWRFHDRAEAGRALAAILEDHRHSSSIVLGIPRGGVIVAREVATTLGVPLDIIITRKLGSPWHPEFAVGAIGEGGVRIVDEEAIAASRITADALRAVEDRERIELDRRARQYRGGRPALDLTGARAIVVDDGVATGATAIAACRAARLLGAAHVTMAAPVAPAEWTARLAGEADELRAVSTPAPFFAVGQWYVRFDQTSDDEVIAALAYAP